MKQLHDCFDKKEWLYVHAKFTILKREWGVSRNNV